MVIYSPKSQKPDVFKKNTIKNQVTYSRKIASMVTTIEFESIHDESLSEIPEMHEKKKSSNRFLNFIKDSFYNRMKVFFDFEDRYKEKAGTFDFVKET